MGERWSGSDKYSLLLLQRDRRFVHIVLGDTLLLGGRLDHLVLGDTLLLGGRLDHLVGGGLQLLLGLAALELCATRHQQLAKLVLPGTIANAPEGVLPGVSFENLTSGCI